MVNKGWHGVCTGVAACKMQWCETKFKGPVAYHQVMAGGCRNRCGGVVAVWYMCRVVGWLNTGVVVAPNTKNRGNHPEPPQIIELGWGCGR